VTAQVPGSVYTDLFRGGVIGDPYYRFNDLAYSWIGYSDWTYSKKFSGERTVLISVLIANQQKPLI
jgi:beta-mannosidase